MKKVIALVLALMLLVVFSVGCKPAETPKPAEAPATAPEQAPATAPEQAPATAPEQAPEQAPAPEKPAH